MVEVAMPKADDHRSLELVQDEMKPYKGPINKPCSACSAGDYGMEYHDHSSVPIENRRGHAPPMTAERKYTLDEFEVLAKQWWDEFQVTDGGTEWAISHLIQYLKKREREVG